MQKISVDFKNWLAVCTAEELIKWYLNKMAIIRFLSAKEGAELKHNLQIFYDYLGGTFNIKEWELHDLRESVGDERAEKIRKLVYIAEARKSVKHPSAEHHVLKKEDENTELIKIDDAVNGILNILKEKGLLPTGDDQYVVYDNIYDELMKHVIDKPSYIDSHDPPLTVFTHNPPNPDSHVLYNWTLNIP